MERKLKSVRNNLIFAIILLIIGNFASIVSIFQATNIIDIIFRLVIIAVIGLFIYAYIKYKKDIMGASKVALITIVIELIIVTINFILSIKTSIVMNQILGTNPILSLISLPNILGYLIPIILLVDTLSIRKLYKNNK